MTLPLRKSAKSSKKYQNNRNVRKMEPLSQYNEDGLPDRWHVFQNFYRVDNPIEK
jgi:hypothetical protein